MKEDILNKTYELVDEIKSMKSYVRLLELKDVIDKDDTVQELMKSFNKQNDLYNEVSKYGKYHPDLKQTKQAFIEIKEALYTHPLINEYKQCEREIERVLNQISRELAQSVSKKIKHPNEIGLIKR